MVNITSEKRIVGEMLNWILDGIFNNVSFGSNSLIKDEPKYLINIDIAISFNISVGKFVSRFAKFALLICDLIDL